MTAKQMLRSIPCLFSSVLHFNLPPMITANQLLLSIPCYKCVAQLLDIFNNYLPLHVIHTQLVIDNADYIYYAEARFRSSK
jgi:hypothetical protein